MHVTFLFIMHEGLPMLAFHDSVSDAWSELVRFVNESWPKRFGTQKPPEDEVKRARAYFRKDELYLVADADLDERAKMRAFWRKGEPPAISNAQRLGFHWDGDRWACAPAIAA